MMGQPMMPSYPMVSSGLSPQPMFPPGATYTPPAPMYGGAPIVNRAPSGSGSPPPPPPKSGGSAGATWTHTGQKAKLHTIGAPLDSNQQVRDAQTGETVAGVGIFFQQEHGDWVYVANVVPNSSADRSGRVRLDDELVRVDDFEVTLDSSLEQIRNRILGQPGTYVMLAFRRPGGQHGMGRKDDYFYFETELMRGNADFIQRQQNVDRAPQRTAPQEQPAMVRAQAPPQQVRAAAPPPPQPPSEDLTKYEEEIRRLRNELEALRNHQANQEQQEDPRVVPLEEELKARMEDLRRFEQMLIKAQEKAKEAERQKAETMQHVANLQQENLQLQAKNAQDAQMLENLSSRQQGDLNMLQKANENLKQQLESERARAQHNSKTLQDQIAKMQEELNRARSEGHEKKANEASLRSRLAQGHATIAEALKTQESQMAVLADIVPSLDMVHSSLISSIAVDPIRLQSYQFAQPPSTQLTSLGPDMGLVSGRPLSMSMNSLPAQSSYVPAQQVLSSGSAGYTLPPFATAQQVGPPREMLMSINAPSSNNYIPYQPSSSGSQLELA